MLLRVVVGETVKLDDNRARSIHLYIVSIHLYICWELFDFFLGIGRSEVSERAGPTSPRNPPNHQAGFLAWVAGSLCRSAPGQNRILVTVLLGG